MEWIVKKGNLKMAKEGDPFAQMNVGLYYLKKGTISKVVDGCGNPQSRATVLHSIPWEYAAIMDGGRRKVRTKHSNSSAKPPNRGLRMHKLNWGCSTLKETS